MSGPPKLTSLALWDKFERRCLQLLKEAMQALACEPADMSEIDLNRKLYWAITKAARQITEYGPFFPGVVLDGRNLPAASDGARAAREFKIPDLYWVYVDALANDFEEINKRFVVECKRLTDPSSTYGGRYVHDGIDRFKNVSHNYSKGMPSGAMVGYLQVVLVDDAFLSVDAVVRADAIPPLDIQNRDGERSLELAHTLMRPASEPPIRLTHVWGRVGPTPH